MNTTETCFCNYIRNGNFNKVIEFLCSGFDVTSTRHPFLRTAILSNNIEMVRILLEHNAYLKISDVCTAVSSADTDILRLLIEQEKCDSNECLVVTGPPLFCAVSRGFTDKVKLLINSRYCDINSGKNEYGFFVSPLKKAICNGSVDIVKLLIERPDCDVNAASLDYTPLVKACEEKQQRIAEMLIERHDCDVNVLSNGITALYVAASNNDAITTRKLLEHGGDPNIESSKISIVPYRIEPPDLPLGIAADRGYTTIVKLLLESAREREYICADSGCHATAMIRAASSGHVEVVNLLLEHNYDPNVIFNGWTALDVAITNNHVSCVKTLLSARARYLRCNFPYNLHTVTENTLIKYKAHEMKGLMKQNTSCTNSIQHVFKMSELREAIAKYCL